MTAPRYLIQRRPEGAGDAAWVTIGTAPTKVRARAKVADARKSAMVQNLGACDLRAVLATEVAS